MYIEMNNKLTFRPTFTEMTLLLVGKSWLLIIFWLMLLLTLLLLCQIFKKNYGNPQLFVEINKKLTFWPDLTEVVLFLVGQILSNMKNELKCGFTLKNIFTGLNKIHSMINFTIFVMRVCHIMLYMI